MTALYGWAGTIRRVDLSHATFSDVDTLNYADRFVGGKGIAGRLYWESVSPQTAAFSPENHIFMFNGPLGGIRATAASRWVVVSRSPMTSPEQYACGNLGGHFGAALKWAGLDGLDIFGAAVSPTILVIEPDGRSTCHPAGDLWGRDVFETITALQQTYGAEAQVAAIGAAGERRVRFANVIATGGGSVSKGFGAVMGSKNLKAVVVRAGPKKLPVARPDDFAKVIAEVNALSLGEASRRLHKEVQLDGVSRVAPAYCYGCSGVCHRGLFRAADGAEGYRINCASAFFYRTWEKARTGSGGDATFYATQLANRHGLGALQLVLICKWLPEAIRSGAVTPHEAALDPAEMGSREWIEALVNAIVNRRGIGDTLAEGSRRAAADWGVEHLLDGIVSKTGVLPGAGHDPRLFLSLVPVYATEPNSVTTQVHEVSKPAREWMDWHRSGGQRGCLTTEGLRQVAAAFWGDARAAEFDTPDAMGAAAVRMQDRAYAKETLVGCDWFWPVNFSGRTEGGVGDPALEARLFAAVTGVDLDEPGYRGLGARCCQQHRAIYLREGRHGRTDDVIEERFFERPFTHSSLVIARVNPEFELPGAGGRLISRKGAKVDREDFRRIMDDYYTERGWDVASGLFRADGLSQIGLADLIPELTERGLVV